MSAQQTIPYVAMHPDGICQIPGNFFTKTVEYEDINYSVASAEDQSSIFGGWSLFINYFDSSLPFELSFINRRSRFGRRYTVDFPPQQDILGSISGEFTDMLKNQIAKSNNGIERNKYITFGIPSDTVDIARPRLERIEADIMGNFKRLMYPLFPLTDGTGFPFCMDSFIPEAVTGLTSLGATLQKPDWERRILSPRTASISGSQEFSVSASIGARHRTCRLWHPSFPTSCFLSCWSLIWK